MLQIGAGHASQHSPLLHLQVTAPDHPAQQSGRDTARTQHSRPSPSRHISSKGCSSSSRSSLTSCTAHSWSTGCRLAGSGSSVPEAVLTNKDLEKLVDTNDEWIRVRTGISRRHVLGEHENLSQHSARAAQNAMDMAHVTAEQVDLVLLATSSPDDTFGSACQVNTELLMSLVRLELCPLWATVITEGFTAHQTTDSSCEQSHIPHACSMHACPDTRC